jgi:hypothetical protein
MGTEHNSHNEGKSRGYETRDINTQFINVIVGLLVVLTLAGLGVSWFVIDFMNQRHLQNAPALSPLANTLPDQPPEPRLQTRPAADIEKMRITERQILESYAWIDEKGGIVRIPVERAMDLIAQRGLPVRKTEAGGREVGKQQ